jgi:hypothetical protein
MNYLRQQNQDEEATELSVNNRKGLFRQNRFEFYEKPGRIEPKTIHKCVYMSDFMTNKINTPVFERKILNYLNFDKLFDSYD